VAAHRLVGVLLRGQAGEPTGDEVERRVVVDAEVG